MREKTRLAALLLFGAVITAALRAPCEPPAQAQPTARNEEETPAGPVPPLEAAGHMTLPEGFHATLFAGEPDLRQPIAFTFDDRGRLWVAECYSYPNWKPEGHDRILIFEDTDGDGRFDRSKVFWDHGANVTGLEIGYGGVWVCATPHLLFIPDRDGDDVPDAEPEVVLDGWDINAKHNVFNGLTWGPDGWLYGCHGILTTARVGKPGTPDDERVPINCGVWRYHPTRERFEAVAWGTTNPWGLDFDDYGEAFITNCVIPHLFHVVPGAHFQRMFGQDFSPYLFGLIGSVADHIHWAGGAWTDSRGGKGKHGEAGGGHAHAGAMIYQGDNWPDAYRRTVLTCNIHGNRVNEDRLERKGSSYVAHHANDFLMANDAWFRGLQLKYGPDGGVFLSDWCDTGECHETDADGAHTENGRIFKITYGRCTPAHPDLGHASDAELVALQLHKNDWYVRHARRILAERAAAGASMRGVHAELREILRGHRDVTRRLRALWALHATGGMDEAALAEALGDADEHIRSWAVRLLMDDAEPSSRVRDKFAAMAAEDRSPLVRLYLASALQRLPLADRWGIAEGLARHGEDSEDLYLPLMTWYGVEPLVPADPARAARLAGACRVPLLRRFMARRAVLADAAGGSAGLSALVQTLGTLRDTEIARDLLEGLLEGLQGRKSVAMPAGWRDAYARLVALPSQPPARATPAPHGAHDAGDERPELTELATVLALVCGDPRAQATLEATMMDRRASPPRRERAVQALVENRATGLAPKLEALLDDASLRGTAIRGLAAYDDDGVPRAILERYSALTADEKADAVSTLASRAAYALVLLDAVEHGRVPRRDLSAFTVRQLGALRDKRIDQKLEKVWGSVRGTSREKAAQMARYKAALTPDALKNADAASGRRAFDQTCAQCHRMFGSGGDVGPELTGSNRANLDYVLENVLDPSAVVPREYQLVVIATRDGRVISGIIREQTDTALVIQTANERVVLSRADVEEMRPSSASMMPEGLFDKLTVDEVRDLVAYLASPSQVAGP